MIPTWLRARARILLACIVEAAGQTRTLFPEIPASDEDESCRILRCAHRGRGEGRFCIAYLPSNHAPRPPARVPGSGEGAFGSAGPRHAGNEPLASAPGRGVEPFDPASRGT